MKLFKFLFSGAFMGILLLVFAYAIGYATFIENDYGAVAAKLLVYNARWFEVLLFLMVVNFVGMIFTKHLYLPAKLNILVIHLALVIIIIGSGVTRYFGYEGSMHIRNGQASNEFVSSDNYLQVKLGSGADAAEYNETFFLTTVRSELLRNEYEYKGKSFEISVNDFYQNALQTVVPAADGKPIITIQVRGMGGNAEYNMSKGESHSLQGLNFNYGPSENTGQIQIIDKDGKLFIRNVFTEEEMASIDTSRMLPDGFVQIDLLQVISLENTAFRISNFHESGEIKYVANTTNTQFGDPIVKIIINEQEMVIPMGRTQNLRINDTDVSLRIGRRTMLLPFQLKLNEFELERYPGSNSPSSFASEVTVIDKANNEEFPYRIYMNHILNYGGYRFFQSSYDQDEQGTILSVNQDYWGTLITYLGYFLLFATLVISFFTKTRFKRIAMQLQDVHDKRKKLSKAMTITLILFTMAATSFAQAIQPEKEHAAKFGELFVQSNAGRIEPINTLSTKVLVKISKKSTYKGLTADQVVLGIAADPDAWRSEPLIKVPESAIQNIIGVSSDYASFSNFLDERGQYKISAQVEAAYQKKPALRSTFDKGLINVDERINVLYSLLNAGVLKIFPLENDPNNKWVSPSEHHQLLGHGNESADLFESYVNSLKTSANSGNYTIADAELEKIAQLQSTLGAQVMPSRTKASVEILYNKLNIFKALFPVYLLLGVLLVGIFLIQIFYPNLEFKMLGKILLIIMAIAFALQTVGLGARWYISGHAPWSNGYESMIYISWATVLAGFLFMKRSAATLGVTALLAGITLLTAHMSWLNPELTNLVPVLKSYWLTFHVATITASYGFLALGCMLAFLNLCIMIFRTKANQLNVDLTLKELMLITEMSLAVGLVLLVIGNFLGGIWANESWGRYWGWDPKETWTLVTVILYSFTLHLTLIPSIRTTFIFSFFSFISFGAVLMTYFGVNYYLSGLHSYANGDPVAVPSFLYYAMAVIGIISVLAAYNEFKFREVEE